MLYRTRAISKSTDRLAVVVPDQIRTMRISSTCKRSIGEAGFIRLAFGTNTCNIVYAPVAPTF